MWDGIRLFLSGNVARLSRQASRFCINSRPFPPPPTPRNPHTLPPLHPHTPTPALLHPHPSTSAHPHTSTPRHSHTPTLSTTTPSRPHPPTPPHPHTPTPLTGPQPHPHFLTPPHLHVLTPPHPHTSTPHTSTLTPLHPHTWRFMVPLGFLLWYVHFRASRVHGVQAHGMPFWRHPEGGHMADLFLDLLQCPPTVGGHRSRTLFWSRIWTPFWVRHLCRVRLGSVAAVPCGCSLRTSTRTVRRDDNGVRRRL